MIPWSGRFVSRQLYIFLGFWAVFAAITQWFLRLQSPNDYRENWNVAATIGTVTGPLTGAIARGLQDGCLRFSLSLLPYCAAFLVGGLVLQGIPKIPMPIRLAAWCIGLLGWFGGAVLSLLNACS